MAFFKTKEEKAAIERQRQEEREQKYRKLAQSEILDDIINNLKNGEEWRYICQGYYDNRIRRVGFDVDLFYIDWKEGQHAEIRHLPNGEETHVTVEDIIESNSYAYTNSGYKPMPDSDDFISMWAEIVRERMMAMWPQCKFGNVVYAGNKRKDFRYCFEYEVPALKWKDWI